MNTKVYNPTPAKGKRKPNKPGSTNTNKKEGNNMATKAKKKSSAPKPQTGQNKTKASKKAVTRGKTAVKTVTKSRSKSRFRNGVQGFNWKRAGLIMLGGVVGYMGTNAIAKTATDMLPSSYATWKPHARVGLKAVVTGLAFWKGHKYVNPDFATGFSAGAAIATLEDGLKTYASAFAPAFVGGLAEVGSFNDAEYLEINGEIDESQYLLPGKQQSTEFEGFDDDFSVEID